MITSEIQSREMGKDRGAEFILAEFTSLLSSAQQLWLICHRRAMPHGLFRLQGRQEMFSSAEHIVISDKTRFLFMRKKGKAEGPLGHKHLLCTAHCSKHFTCHNSLEPYNNLAMWILIILL